MGGEVTHLFLSGIDPAKNDRQLAVVFCKTVVFSAGFSPVVEKVLTV
jgi:microcystin degradation protein MlrC